MTFVVVLAELFVSDLPIVELVVLVLASSIISNGHRVPWHNFRLPLRLFDFLEWKEATGTRARLTH